MLEVYKDGSEFRVYENEEDIVAIIWYNGTKDRLEIQVGDLPIALSVHTGVNIQHCPSTEVSIIKQSVKSCPYYEMVVVNTVCTDVIYANF